MLIQHKKDLNHAYIVFNTSDLVEELSNAIVKPSTMRVEIYRNSRGLKLPQSYGVKPSATAGYY